MKGAWTFLVGCPDNVKAMEKKITINRRTRNVIFPKLEKDEVMTAAKGRIRHDYRQNIYLAGGDLEELAQFLRDAGYDVELVGKAMA